MRYVFVTFLSFFQITVSYTQSNLSCEHATATIKTFQRYHYQPAELNRAQELRVALQTIRLLDEFSVVFLLPDIEQLLAESHGLLDTTNSKACSFAKSLEEKYRYRASFSDSVYHEVLKQPLLVRNNETVLMEFDSTEGFAKSKDELVKMIRLRLNAYALMEYHYSYVKRDTVSGKELSKYADFDEKIRSEMLGAMDCDKEDNVTLSQHIAEIILNEIALLYDPHSVFFSPVERKQFETSLSSEQKSFGIMFGDDEKGHVIVQEIMPGGSAWLSGDVYEGDELDKVTTRAGAEISINCLSGFEITEKLDQGTEEEVTFHMRHADGSDYQLRLKRDLADVSENVIRGLVLSGNKKVGYVALPSFYTDWSSDNNLGCSNDLAKEIISLKNEGVEGLILDLRYNGGGSVDEALALAGLFVNEGSLLIRTDRNHKPRLLKDPNRGVVYADPLIVLVNGFSASASEIVAAALQDYNRAVIIGSVTFGKSTGQSILPLLSSSGRGFSDGRYGYVKVTQSVIHRISGESHQSVGVIPDIILPDPYSGLYEREGERYGALKLSKIDKKTYAYPLSPLPIEELNESSVRRLEDNGSTKVIPELNERLKVLYDRRSIPLNHIQAGKFVAELNSIGDELEATLYQESDLFKAVQHGNSENLTKFDHHEKLAFEQHASETQKDIMIQEAYQVMLDWLDRNTNTHE